jgi:hypothetical protein
VPPSRLEPPPSEPGAGPPAAPAEAPPPEIVSELWAAEAPKSGAAYADGSAARPALVSGAPGKPGKPAAGEAGRGERRRGARGHAALRDRGEALRGRRERLGREGAQHPRPREARGSGLDETIADFGQALQA